MDLFISESIIKQEPNTDSDGSEEENIHMRRNKFYNESTEEETFKDVENIYEDNGSLSHKNNNRFQNIIIVADDLYKDYVSKLKSESTNINVLACKSLSSLKMDLLNQEENTLWMIVTGLYTVSTVNNLSDLNSPYIPGIKKLSWNMKKLPEFGEEYRQLRNDLKELLPDSCAAVVLPPLPAALMVNAVNTTKSQKFNSFYCSFIKNITELTIEMVEEQDLPCSNSIKNYLDIKDSVFEIKSSSSQDLGVVTMDDWKALREWYNILEDIAGLKMVLDRPFLGYKQSDAVKESINNVHSAASFIRQANLVTSDNIPEIEKLDECMIPQLTKWPAALDLKSFSNKKESDYELKIFQNEVYKLQVDKLKVESNVSRTVVVVGEKLAVRKFCDIDIPKVKFHQLYVEDNDYEAIRKNIPSNLFRAENTIWILFCDIASSMKKKKQSFCERHFPEKKCNVELNMNSLNCSTEKDRCKKLNEFVQNIYPSLSKNSFIIPVPIIPQTSLLPPSDTFKMEDFHNIVHESDDLRNLWIFLPSMQKLQIKDAIKKFDKDWWKNIEKIMIQQNLNVEFLLDFKENTHQTVDVLENHRLFKVNNKAYEEWEHFIKAFIVLYLHALDNPDSAAIYFKKGAPRGVLMLGEDSSSSTTTTNGKKLSVLRTASIVKPPVLHNFAHRRPQGTHLNHIQEQSSQGMKEFLTIYKRKMYLYDIPKTLTNSALKEVLNICGYVTGFQRDVVEGIRAATCMVEFRDIGSIYRAYHLLNGLKIVNSTLCVVIPEEKHFTTQEKVFDPKYEKEDSTDIKGILADRNSWGSKSPEHQKLVKSRPDLESRYLQTKRHNFSEEASPRYPKFFNRRSDRSRSQERSLLRDHNRHSTRSISRERSPSSRDRLSYEETLYLKRQLNRSSSRERSLSRDVRMHSDSSPSSEGSPPRDLNRRSKRSKSRDRRSRSREKIKSRKQHKSRDHRDPQSRSRSRSQEINLKDGISYEMYEEKEYKKSHKRSSSPKQNSSSGFPEGSECLALISLSEKLGVLAISFKLLMKSCIEAESLDILYEEDNMLLMNTIMNKFVTLQSSTSDIIDVEKFKCGAKICNKLMETVISKKASKQIELPPTIPLHLPAKTVQKQVNLLNSSTLYESTIPKRTSYSIQPSSCTSNFPSTSRIANEPSTVEEKNLFLHGVDIGRIAKCTLGKDAAAIKDFINNSLEYVGVTPNYDIVFEIYSSVSMLHFNWADN